MAVSHRQLVAGPKKWRDHPWSPALFTALGILLAVACGLLSWGLYRVVSTYFFIFAAAICLSEALWRPKMALKGALTFFTTNGWSPRAFVLTRMGMACCILILAIMIRHISVWECASLLAALGIVVALDVRLSSVFHLHRWLLTDDDLVALVCLIGLLLVCILGIALPVVGIANESAELAQQVGTYSQYIPEFKFAEAVKSFGLDGMVRDMGEDYRNATWYVVVNRTVHDVVEGEFDLVAEWNNWRGNRTAWEALTYYAEKFYREASGLEDMPASELAKQIAHVLSTSVGAVVLGLRGTLGMGLSIAALLTDKAIRVCYFLSLLFYFLGRENSVLQVLLEMLGDESALATELQDILSSVFKYPAARLVTRFWSTCLLAYAFNVRYTWILSATTMVMSFAPIALGSYPYLVAVPWWLCGSVRGGMLMTWAYEGVRSCNKAIFPTLITGRWSAAVAALPWGIGESPEEFWLGAAFMVCMLIVHSWLDSVELALFSVSKYVPPYAIGLAVLLGFEHFGIWALFYCPLLLCAATLGYRICIKGEFMHGAVGGDDAESAAESSEANDETDAGAAQAEEPEDFLQLTSKLVRRMSVAAQKVHSRSGAVPPKPALLRRHSSLDADRHQEATSRDMRRRGTAPVQSFQQGGSQ